MYVIDKSKYQFFTFLTILCMFILISSSAHANEFDVYAKAESFTWKEYDNDGSQLLEESGPIYGIGFKGKFESNTKSHLTFKFRVEVFGGQVDYDGQDQNNIPTKSNTTYIGSKQEGDIGLKIALNENFAIEPFAGLGYRYWERDLENSQNALGDNVEGYTEKWSNLYTRLGVFMDIEITKIWKIFAEGGVKLPVYNEYKINDVTVKPGKKTSVFVEFGTKISIFKAIIFYENMRFSKSPVVYTGIDLNGDGLPDYGHQPKSEADMYGVNIGISF